MTKDDYARRRRAVVARHDPPLVHISDAAALLGLSTDAARWHLKHGALKPYSWPKPFARGTYYEADAVEALAKQLSDNKD